VARLVDVNEASADLALPIEPISIQAWHSVRPDKSARSLQDRCGFPYRKPSTPCCKHKSFCYERKPDNFVQQMQFGQKSEIVWIIFTRRSRLEAYLSGSSGVWLACRVCAARSHSGHWKSGTGNQTSHSAHATPDRRSSTLSATYPRSIDIMRLRKKEETCSHDH